ncbi:MAG: hypothetical protein KA149_10720 [Chitinophagales bacterium]|nr:hypothetical protein [Chitinophagales bacterium]
MKHILLAIFILTTAAIKAQTLPDSIQKQLAELRQQQAELKEIVTYGGRDIKTGAGLLAPGIVLMTAGTILGILPTSTSEKNVSGMPVKKLAGVICVGAGGVFSIAGAISMFNGGKKMHWQRVYDL